MQSSKKLGLIIKLLIVVLSFWFLYQKIFDNDSIEEIKLQFLALFENKRSHIDLFFVFGLMLVNWSIDAFKWRFLISKIEKVSFWLSLKAVFLGITVSMFTPNRVGEFGGRVFCLSHADRIKAVLITIFGNVNQLFITLIFGLVALVLFASEYSMSVLPSLFSNTLLLTFFALIIIICLLVGLFNTSRFLEVLTRWKTLKKYTEYCQTLDVFTNRDILAVLGLSITRYFVYSYQFFMLLKYTGLDISFLDSMIMSSLTFFSMSVIPSIALTEIGVRGSVSVFFFGFISDNVLGIMTAAFSLWFINLVLPAIVGTLFVYQLKFFRT